jgi:hypothetical protein
MPGHSARYCTYEIEYENPSGIVWQKKWSKSVRTDEDITDFKRTCQNVFMTATGANLDSDGVWTVFHDGYSSRPPDTKEL